MSKKRPSPSQRSIIALKTAFAVQTAGSALGDGAFADTAQGIVQLGPDAGVVAVTAGQQGALAVVFQIQGRIKEEFAHDLLGFGGVMPGGA